MFVGGDQVNAVNKACLFDMLVDVVGVVVDAVGTIFSFGLCSIWIFHFLNDSSILTLK